jgi:hypothetical protein
MYIFNATKQPLRAGSLVGAMIAATLSLCISSADAAGPQMAPADKAAVLPAQFAITATFQELMDAEMDAPSEKIWTAVSIVNDASGSHEKTPSTPDEWQELRRQAIRLAETSNLLMIPGRPVAGTTVKTTVKSKELLDVAAIQKRLAVNPAALAAFAQSARTVALQLVDAVDRRDVQKLSDLGGSLDEVCEACHKTFWYPDQK